MSLSKKKYGSILFGSISLFGLLVAFLLIYSNLENGNSNMSAIAALLFLISAIPAILGIRSGIKLLKTGHKILGGLGIVMSSVIPLFVLLAIVLNVMDLLVLFQ